MAGGEIENMTGVLGTLVAGTKGFDCNQIVSASSARAFVAAGYSFVLRYVPRLRAAASDLFAAEVQTLLAAGLSVMPVQHVEAGEWTPTLAKGSQYGTVAANMARAAGIVAGTTVWLDLESVNLNTPAWNIIDYCTDWFICVQAAGFQPGLYVGWQCGLSPTQIYALPFTRYWSGYNLNIGEFPAKRNVCMKQRAAHREDRPEGETLEFDVNDVLADYLNGLPSATCPQ
jgi:hypothetical protein